MLWVGGDFVKDLVDFYGKMLNQSDLILVLFTARPVMSPGHLTSLYIGRCAALGMKRTSKYKHSKQTAL